MIGYITASRRVPVVVLVVGVGVTAVLHNGKNAMRTIYWEEGKPAPGLTKLPGFFAEWFQRGLTSTRRKRARTAR